MTTFTLSEAGEDSRVRISTVWEGTTGVGGFFERLFAPIAMRKIYRDELDRLDAYAKNRAQLNP